MKQETKWKSRMLGELYRLGHPYAATFFTRAVGDLLDDIQTRREFSDGFEVYRHMATAMVDAGMVSTLPGFRSQDPMMHEALRSTAGSLRESRAWFQARPVWIDTLRRHLPTMDRARDRMYALGGRALLLVVTDDPGAPPLDFVPPPPSPLEGREPTSRAIHPTTAERNAAWEVRWKAAFSDELREAGDHGLVPWLVAVAEDVWTRPEVSERFMHVSEVAAQLYLLMTHALISLVNPGPGDERHPPEPIAVESFESLRPYLSTLRDRTFWMDAMKRHAGLLPRGNHTTALAVLRLLVLEERGGQPGSGRLSR